MSTTFISNNSYYRTKGGRSANKFRKSQICKFADKIFFIDLQTFRKCGMLFCGFAISGSYILRFVDLRFADPIRCCGFKTSANPQKYRNFLLANISLKCSHSNLKTTFCFRDSFETWHFVV